MCKTCRDGGPICRDAICIEDMAGPDGFWADWCPHDKKVYFGGIWYGIPPMPSQTLPDDKTWREWVHQHEKQQP